MNKGDNQLPSAYVKTHICYFSYSMGWMSPDQISKKELVPIKKNKMELNPQKQDWLVKS